MNTMPNFLEIQAVLDVACIHYCICTMNHELDISDIFCRSIHVCNKQSMFRISHPEKETLKDTCTVPGPNLSYSWCHPLLIDMRCTVLLQLTRLALALACPQSWDQDVSNMIIADVISGAYARQMMRRIHIQIISITHSTHSSFVVE